MRHIQLEAWTDENGTLGLIVAGNKGEDIYADESGRLIAHDILEHQNGIAKIGCPADELEALGGLWQVRGRHGDLVPTAAQRRFRVWRDPYEDLASDVIVCARDTHGGGWWPALGRYRTHRHDYDEDFMEILAHARKHIHEEVEPDFPVGPFLDNALHLMRTGFRKAERRFGTGFKGIDTFRAVAEATERAARHIEFEGQRFRLSYGNGEARCEEIYMEGDYE